ncbi:hypothetical protein VNI00_006187 [Paramarasmius palmivorus]|uniref:Uncharacterized protein n=1 Tax=Paramarasmius palmivorus TaxID=297713 RepID=A0AAW0D935_9AGAR
MVSSSPRHYQYHTHPIGSVDESTPKYRADWPALKKRMDVLEAKMKEFGHNIKQSYVGLTESIESLDRSSAHLRESIERLERLERSSAHLTAKLRPLVQKQAERRSKEIKYEISRALSQGADKKVLESAPVFANWIRSLQRTFTTPRYLLSPSSLVINLYVVHKQRYANDPAKKLLSAQVMQVIPLYEYLAEEKVMEGLFLALEECWVVHWTLQQGTEFWKTMRAGLTICSESLALDLAVAVYLKAENLIDGLEVTQYRGCRPIPTRDELELYLRQRENEGWEDEFIDRVRELANEQWSMGV